MNPVWGFYNRRKNWWRRGKRVGKRLIIINITIILLVFWNSYWFLKNMGSKWSKKKKKNRSRKSVKLHNKNNHKERQEEKRQKSLAGWRGRRGHSARDRKALLAEEAGEGTVCRDRLEKSLWIYCRDERQHRVRVKIILKSIQSILIWIFLNGLGKNWNALFITLVILLCFHEWI